MILHRLADAIREQNWFTVFIEVLIVMIGIFLGLQVTQWNENRKERALEAIYTQRLHQEVLDLSAVRTPLVQSREIMVAELKSAFLKLSAPEGEALGNSECFHLGYNPAVTNPTDDLPLIVELLSSGRLTIFTDERLEKALGNFLIARTKSRDSGTGIARRIPDLDHNYNHLFTINRSMSEAYDAAARRGAFETGSGPETIADIFSNLVTCDDAAMRANTQFLNDLAAYELKYYFHIQDNRRVSNSLKALHDALDNILGITHSGGEKQ